jgi:MFS family permease
MLRSPRSIRSSLTPSEGPKSEFTLAASTALGGVSLSMMLLPSLLAVAVFPVILRPMSGELGWTRTQASLALTLLQVGVVINSPMIGLLIARFGPRRVAIPALLISALLLALTGEVGGHSLLGFYFAYGLVGLSTAGFMPFYALTATWFHRRRALAFGGVSAGATLAIVIVPLAANALLGPLGWRLTYGVLGFAGLAVAVPIFSLLAREHPGDLVRTVRTRLETRGARDPWLRQTLSSPVFWMLLLAQAGATAATNATLAQAVAMMSERGLKPSFGALVVSAMGLGGLLAQALSGLALDRTRSPKVMTPFALAALAGLVVLQFAATAPLILLGALCVGVGAGGESSHIAYFVTRYFGLMNYSRVYGAMMPITTLLSAPAPMLIGALFDATGSYRSGFFALEAMFGLTAPLFWLMAPYRFRALTEHAGEPMLEA